MIEKNILEKTITIIVPCYNEERNIIKTIRKIKKSKYYKKFKIEILIVDDGSTDNTLSIIKKLQLKNIRFFSNKKNMGIGYSFFNYAKYSRNNYITLIPGDGENDLDQTLNYVNLLDSVDIIIPFIVNQKKQRTLVRTLLSRLYNFIVNFSFGVKLNYTNGTVIFNKNILENIKVSSNSFFYQTEFLISLIRQGYLYAEVPHFLNKRLLGKSKAVTIMSFIRVVLDFIKFFLKVHFIRSSGRNLKHFNKKSITYLRKKNDK